MAEASRSRGLTFSSEAAVVPRWYGGEILDHSPKSVRMDFINSGRAPLLMYHDMRQQVGVIEKANIGGDRIGHATARFGRNATASDALANVDDRIYVNTSVGYRVHEMMLDSENDGEPIYRITDWEPYEVSIVGVPADTNVGLGRSIGVDTQRFASDVQGSVTWLKKAIKLHQGHMDGTVKTSEASQQEMMDQMESALEALDDEAMAGRAAVLPIAAGPPGDTTSSRSEAAPEAASSSPAPAEATTQVSITQSAQAAGVRMSDQGNAAGNSAEGRKITATEAEQERRTAIQNLCRANKIDSRVEARWIEEGTQLVDVRDANGKVIEAGVASQILDVMEARGRQNPMQAASLGLSAREADRFSLFRAVRALRFGGQRPKLIEEAAYEIECSNAVGKRLGRELTSSILIPSEVLQRPLGEAASRAMATTPGSKGGYLVNVQNMGFIDILRNRSVAMAMGARVLSGLTGNVIFPRQTGKVTVTWQAGEGTSVTAADQALGQLSMTPKTCIAITDVSEQLLAQSSPSAEAFVMADLAADVAIDGVDNASINGTGGAQPLGIKNTTGVTTGQSASTFSYAKALAFPVAAGAVNAIRGNPGWVTNIAGASIAMQRQRFTSTDSPLWEGDLLDGRLVGFRAMSSEQLAANNIIFGSWDELVIGEWGVLELSTDNGGTRFNTAQVGIRAMWMVDIMLRYPQAFVVGTDLS